MNHPTSTSVQTEDFPTVPCGDSHRRRTTAVVYAAPGAGVEMSSRAYRGCEIDEVDSEGNLRILSNRSENGSSVVMAVWAAGFWSVAEEKEIS